MPVCVSDITVYVKSASALNVIAGIHDTPARRLTKLVIGVAASMVMPLVPIPAPKPRWLNTPGPALAVNAASPIAMIDSSFFIP